MIELLLAKIADTFLGRIIGKALGAVFPGLFSDTKAILDMHERRIKEKEKIIDRLKSQQDKAKQQHQSEKARMIQSLKHNKLSTTKLVEKYSGSLNAILISYASQHEDAGEGKYRRAPFIREELEKFGAKYLGGTTSVIPPSKVPGWIKTEKDLQRWFRRYILKGRHCKLKFLILFDLKNKTFWETNLPYKQQKPKHHSLGEVLNMEDLFSEEQIEKIALSEIIRAGDILWLASTVLPVEELEKLRNNQDLIEKQLGHASLREISQKNIKPKLKTVLAKFLTNTDEVADAIIGEAQFWESRLSK